MPRTSLVGFLQSKVLAFAYCQVPRIEGWYKDGGSIKRMMLLQEDENSWHTVSPVNMFTKLIHIGILFSVIKDGAGDIDWLHHHIHKNTDEHDLRSLWRACWEDEWGKRRKHPLWHSCYISWQAGHYCSWQESQLGKTDDHSSPHSDLKSIFWYWESWPAERKLPEQYPLQFSKPCDQNVWYLQQRGSYHQVLAGNQEQRQ